MNISFSGAQSTGKTTLLNECKQNPFFNGFEFVPEVTRLVKRKFDVDINEAGNDITQLCIINQHLENYLNLKSKDVVMDRCILDGVVYTEYLYNQGMVSNWILEYAKNMFHKLVSELDIILYTFPDVPLEDDGERSVNVGFREDVIQIFEKYMDMISTSYQNVSLVTLKGSVDERMEKLVGSVEKILEKQN